MIKEIAKSLVSEMIERELSKPELLKRVKSGVTAPTIDRILKGKKGYNIESLFIVAKAIGLDSIVLDIKGCKVEITQFKKRQNN
jgi:hypothetical protein